MSGSCTHAKVDKSRLGKLAISSRQAAIQGMLAITEEDGRYIAKALLAMRGVNQKICKAMRENGNLKLHPKPFVYKGTPHAWLRNLRVRDGLADWAKELVLPEGPVQKEEVVGLHHLRGMQGSPIH